MKNPITLLRGLRPLFPSVLPVLAAVLAFAQPGALSAATYSWTSSGGGDHPRKLLLNIPASVDSGVVRGILIHGNGFESDETAAALDAELVAFAESIGFAVLATGNWGKFDIDSGGVSSEFNTFNSRLAAFATASGHPELVHAPWIAEGYSNGGQMAYGLNVLAPAKTIAFVANKGGYYNDDTPTAAARATPGLLIAGENDTYNNNQRRNKLRTIFNTNRALGALWAWVEEENMGHYAGESYKLIRPFLEECVKLRYPASVGLPETGPVTLLDLDEEDGWIVNEDTWTSGLTDVHPYAEETGDPFDYGWVPNQRIAYLYRAFSTYNKASGAVGGSSIVVNTTLPATLSFNVNMTGQSWTKIEFYEGETKIGEKLSSEGSNPSVTLSAATGGYRVFHGVVTKSNSTLSATLLHPVFVVGPVEEPEAPLAVLVDFGPSGTTTTGGDDPANTWNNFTSNTTNASLALVDTTGASTGITLTLTDNFTGTSSNGSTSPTAYVVDAVRDTHYFDNGKTPQLKLSGLDPTRLYTLKFLGSRVAGDGKVRSTLFTAQGFDTLTTVNNATDNTGTTSTITDLLPTAGGEITIDLDDAATNDTTSKVGYLGVLELTSAASP